MACPECGRGEDGDRMGHSGRIAGEVERAGGEHTVAAGEPLLAGAAEVGADPGRTASWETMQLATQPIQHQAMLTATQPILRPIPQPILESIQQQPTWPSTRPRTFLSSIRAWMVVLP